jgi:3'-5' exoribonuclease
MISDMKQKIMNGILNGNIKNNKEDIIKYVIEEKKKMDEVIKSVIYAKIDQIMNSDSMVNLIVTLDDKTRFNLKLECERAIDLFLNCIYEFEIARNTNSDKLSAYVVSYKHITEIDNTEKQNEIYRKFMDSAVLDYTELKNGIEGYIESIKTKSLHDITKSIIDKYSKNFYLYPAAAKLHHAYVGGLAYHTMGMLEVAKRIIECYPYLDYDLLISGTILHDVGKVIEFTGVENTEYAMKGQLLGHLLIGCDIISQTAKELGYTGDEEEVLMLLHMVASHHGIPQYGAIKKPCIAESAMLWFIDSIDSKFRVLGDELAKVKDGEFTEPIGVMDRVKFYKHK